MDYCDHAPPHSHAIHEHHEAEIEIETLAVRRGHLPGRALRLVREWGRSYKEELQADWALARAGRPLNVIPPLE